MANFLKRLFRGSKDPAPQPKVEPAAVSEPAPAPAPEPAPAPQGKTEKHQVTGIKYYMDAIMSLAKPNPDYTKNKEALQRAGLTETTVTEYTWPVYEAELEPEPDNPHDPNAIKVLANGLVVGYIKAGSCARVLKRIREDRIERMTIQFGGGRGKILVQDIDNSVKRQLYTVEERNTVYWANLFLHLKPEK